MVFEGTCRMIRVAWRVPNTPNWIGGLNYFKNLLDSLEMLPERSVQPVVLGDASGLPGNLGKLESIPELPCHTRFSIKRLTYRLEQTVLRNGSELARHLKRHNIHLLSHSDILGDNSPVPALGWIPDFQHRHMPEYFDEKEIELRNSIQARMSREMQGIVFSSNAARHDFEKFYPNHICKTYTMHFVATPPSASSLPPPQSVLSAYEISEPFFHVPNQLWAHKNHQIVLDALRILVRQGRCPLVISTGQTHDYRDPHYFPLLLDKIKDAGLENSFRFLGLIDFAHVSVIMRSAVAVINPSLFEGWSTTVEEAKSLGKQILLSDIDVHREQAPERGVFFPADKPEVLAGLMCQVLAAYDKTIESEAEAHASNILLPRRIAYAASYEHIVRETTGR